MVYIAAILLTLAAYVVLGNIVGILDAFRRRRSGISGGFSCVPILAIVFCVLAWLFGRQSIGAWAFLPVAIDPATWSLIALPFYLALRRRTGRA